MTHAHKLKFLFSNKKGTPDQEQEFQNHFRIEQSRLFAKRYMNLMSFLFTMIILKRVLTDDSKNLNKVVFHLIVIALYFAFMKIHQISDFGVRIMPLTIGLLSYFGHTQFLSMNSVKAYQCDQLTHLNIDLNDLFKHIVVCGAFFINHIYIDIFLTINERDSLVLNLSTWSLFLYDAFTHPSLSVSSKASLLILAIFVIKFSIDARSIKDQIFLNYMEQKKSSNQWLSIFEKLPIGVLITHENKILFSNKKMHQIVGQDNICNLEDIDQSLLIQDDYEPRSGLEKIGSESFQNVINSKSLKVNSIKQVLGKVRKNVYSTVNNIDSLENSFSSNSLGSQNKFYNGDQTFTFLFHKIHVLERELTIIIFVDITQQELLCKSNLEQKYKNIFLSSISHSLRTPLNILQLNNSTLRGLLRENACAMDILNQDYMTHDLLNYQIADILDYSKMETNEFKTNFTHFDFRALLQKINDIFGPMATQKKLFFHMKIESKVPTMVFQDESRLGQVLVNILTNAVKFTFTGQVKMIVDQIEKNGKKRLQVVIRDTGRGIENLGMIGKWFGNLSVLEGVNQSGIGFGITISKKLMNKLGGDIMFENNQTTDQQGTGLTVTLEFPYEREKLSPLRNIFNNSEVFKGTLQGDILYPKIFLDGLNQSPDIPSINQNHDDMDGNFDGEEVKEEMQDLLSIQFSIEDERSHEESIEQKVLDHTDQYVKTLKNRQVLSPQLQSLRAQKKQMPSVSDNFISIQSLLMPFKKDRKSVYQGKEGREREVSFCSKGGIPSQRSKRAAAETPKDKKPIKQDSYQQQFTFLESGNQVCCNKILVVDDNPFNVKSIELMLEYCFGISCDTAFSGKEALMLVEERLQKLHKFGCQDVYPLILTDINMPEMDGIQMTKKVRYLYDENIGSRPDQCTIWAITAMNETEIQDMIGNDMLDGITVKPISHQQLSDILFKSLKIKQQQQI